MKMEGGDREDDITERETEMNEAYGHCDGGGKGEEHSTEEGPVEADMQHEEHAV